MTFEQIYERASQLYELKEYGDSEAATRAGLDLAPGFAPFYHILALCLYHREEWEAAEAAGLRAVALDPELHRGYYSLGLIYLSQDKPRLALQALDNCLRLAPEDALAHALTARVLLYTEQWQPALARALEALALDEHCGLAMNAYAEAQLALGEPEAAEELLVRFAAIHPEDLDVAEKLGWVALEQRNWGVALDCFALAGVKEGIFETMRRQLPLYRWLRWVPRWLPLAAALAGVGIGEIYPGYSLLMLATAFAFMALRPSCNGYLWWRKAPVGWVERSEFVVCALAGLIALSGGNAGRAFISGLLVLFALDCGEARPYAALLVAAMLSLVWGSMWEPILWLYFNRALFPVIFLLVLLRWRA